MTTDIHSSAASLPTRSANTTHRVDHFGLLQRVRLAIAAVSRTRSFLRSRVPSLGTVLRALLGDAHFDGEVLTTCEDCEQACERVVPGAYPCFGREVGDCDVCMTVVQVVEVNARKHCRASRYHHVARVRPKPKIPNAARS